MQSVQSVQAYKPVVAKAGRRKMAAPIKPAVATTPELRCAGDVLKFGETTGWV